MIPDASATGDAGLRDDEGVATDLDVVSDLHEIVDFRAFTDEGAPESGSVDGGIRSDFHIIFHYNNPELGDFGVFTLHFLEPESVASDDATGVDDDPVFDLAAVQDCGSWVEDAMGTDVGMIAHIAVSVHDGVGTDTSVGFDDTERADAR